MIMTIEADPAFQAAFAIHVPAFVKEVSDLENRIKEKYTNG